MFDIPWKPSRFMARLLAISLAFQPLFPVGLPQSLAAAVPPPPSGQVVLFGPQSFVRTNVRLPNVFVASVDVPRWVVAPYLLHVENGGPAGHRTVAAWVKINGRRVLGPWDFWGGRAGGII